MYDLDQSGPGWATEDLEAEAPFGTWNLANGAEPGISWNDAEILEQTRPVLPVFGGFSRQIAMQGYVRRPYNRRNNHQNTHFFEPPKDSREVYWCSTGPKTETKRMMGHTLELPVIAPSSAPPEDKKLILTQTRDRIAEVSPGDWPAKTHLLAQRFIVAVPNAANEAKVRLHKMKDWTSNVFGYSSPSGLQGNFEFTDLTNTTILRYLSFEMHVQSRNAPTPELPVPGLPGERIIEAIVKVPLNALGTDVHPICTPQNLTDPKTLLRDMKQVGLEIQLGKRSPANTFDPAAFDREFRTILSECMFSAVEAILNRDYIGKGITQDIQKRLRDCRQVLFHQGRYRVKTVTEQHADFMRLVQEFDVDEHIPANLPNIAFHNLAKNIQAEMINQQYEPPTECHTTAEQYQKLAEFHEKALEAERKLNQMETMVKRFSGINRNGNAAAFMARLTPEDAFLANDDESIWKDNIYNTEISTLTNQNAQLKTMLSVAERAIRRASGELAPIECWGCKDLPEYNNDKFHRYRFCPRRNDPKVKANFDKNLREWTSRKRSGGSFRTQELGHNKDQTLEPAHKRTHLSLPSFPDLIQHQHHSDDNMQDIKQQLGQVSADTDLLMEFGISHETDTPPARLSVNTTRIISNLKSEENKENVAPPSSIRTTKNQYKHTPDWAENWKQMFDVKIPIQTKQTATDDQRNPNFLQRYTGKYHLPTEDPLATHKDTSHNTDGSSQAAIILCNLKATAQHPTRINKKLPHADVSLNKSNIPHPGQQLIETTQGIWTTHKNNNSPHYKKFVLNQPKADTTPFPTNTNQKTHPKPNWKTPLASLPTQTNTTKIHEEKQKKNLPITDQPKEKIENGTRTHRPNLPQKAPTTLSTNKKIGAHNFCLLDRTKLCPRTKKIMKLFCPANMSVPRGPHNAPRLLNTPPRFPTVNPPSEPTTEVAEILDEWRNEPHPTRQTTGGNETRTQDSPPTEHRNSAEIIDFVEKALTAPNSKDPEEVKWQEIFQSLQEDNTPVTSVAGSEDLLKGTGMNPDIGPSTYTAPDLDCKEWKARATRAVKSQIQTIGELIVADTNIEPGVKTPLALAAHPLTEQEEGLAILPAKGEPSLFIASLEDHIARGALGFKAHNSEATHNILNSLIKNGYLDGLADADLWCHTGHGLLRLSNAELEMPPPELLSQHHWDIRWAMFEGALLHEGACSIEVVMLKAPEDPECSAEAALKRIKARNKLDLEDKSTCGQTLRAAITELTEEPNIKEIVKAVMPSRPATKCMVTKLTPERKIPLNETASTEGSGDSEYGSDEEIIQNALNRFTNKESPEPLWTHDTRHMPPFQPITPCDPNPYRHPPMIPSHCHTHFHLPPGLPFPQIQQLSPTGVWSLPHLFGYAREIDSPEDTLLQTELAREKDVEYDTTFDEELALAQFLVMDKADRGNQEITETEENLAHLLLNWIKAKNMEDFYRKLIGNEHVPKAEHIAKRFESGLNPILGENYVGATPLMIPFDISPTCWTQMKKAHRITQSDLCLAVSQIEHHVPFLLIDVIKARKIRDWYRAKSAVDMLNEALKNEGYSPLLARTCLHEFSKSLGRKNFIGQLKVFNTHLHPDNAESNHEVPYLLQLSGQARPHSPPEGKFGRRALDPSRETHLERLNDLSAAWYTGAGTLDYVKVAVKFDSESLPLFFLLDNGSPKSILNLKVIRETAHKTKVFLQLITYIEANATTVPTLRHPTGWSVSSAIPLRITWNEYDDNSEQEDADDVVEPFGITTNIPGLICHGILGRDFLQKSCATYSVDNTSGSASITIRPYWGRAISTNSVDPTKRDILNPLTTHTSTHDKTAQNHEKRPRPEPFCGQPNNQKKYVSIWNGRNWKKEAQLLKAHNIRIVDQAVFTNIPPALAESRWDHTRSRSVYTRPSTVTIDPKDYALVDTDFTINSNTPSSAIIVFTPTSDRQSHCTIRPHPTPPQQITGAFITVRKGLRGLMVKIRNNGDHPWTVSQKLIGKAEIWQAPDRKSWHLDIADGERRLKIIRQNKAIEPPISDDENNSHVCVYKTPEPKKPQIRPPTPYYTNHITDHTGTEDMSYSTEPSYHSTNHTSNQNSDISYNTPSTATTTTPYQNRDTTSSATEDNMSTDSENESNPNTLGDVFKTSSLGVSKTKESGYSRTTSSIQIQPNSGRSKKRKHPRLPAFLGFIRVNQSVLKRKVFPVATTEMLPHILFPVGDAEPGTPWQKLTTIRGLLDTGSGVNIGYKPYWESVAVHYPKLVKEFGQLDPDDHEELTVGGIEKSGEGTSCSHFIILKTPFSENGSPIELRIALTDGLSCNLIFGLPFIVKSKMVINVWEKYVASPVFQASFPLLYHPPELRESVVTQDGTTPVLKASPPDE